LSTWPDDVQATQPYLELLVGIQPLGWAGERLARLEPEQLRQQIFVAVRRLFISLTRRQPLVVFLDDLHWIDPVSAELLQFVFTAVTSVPIFFVCAQRREGSDAPNDRLLRLYSLLPGQTAHIMLDRLPPAMSQLLLSDLLPGATLSPQLQGTIIARSEGNPYFIEEFVRMFIEQGYVEKEGEKWRLVSTMAYDPAAIPASLETLIRSRVDALPEELRHTLQYAAILGQKFDIDLLAAITNNPNVWLSVERLASRLMLEAAVAGHRWQFSHTLYETVVYESMLKVHRRLRHHHVAQVLQQLWTDAETDHAKELAYHFMRADEQLKALPYLIRAGEQAANQYATEEALAYYRSASEIIAQLPQPDPEWQWRIAVGLGEAYRFLGNYAESLTALQTNVPPEKRKLLPRLKQADLYRRMAETARKQGDFVVAENYLATAQELLGDPEDGAATLELSRILIGLAWVYFAQGHLAQTREACETGLAYAQAADGLNELATAHNLLGGVYYQLGEWRDAFHHTTRAMILREQMGYSWGVAGTLSNLGILAFIAGNWHKSVSFFERSLSLRQEIGDVEGIAITLNNLGNACRGQGKLEEAERSFRDSVLTAETFQINYHHANSAVGLAHVLLLQGKLEEAQTWIERGLRQAEAIGAQDVMAEGQRIRAELLLEGQAPGPAFQTAEKAAALAAAVGNPSYEAAAWRVAAQAALVRNDLELGERLVQKAAALLTGTTDHLEAAHVAAQAYRIYAQTGKAQLARENLAAAREAYTRLGAAHYLRQLEQSEAVLVLQLPQQQSGNKTPT
jgi:predicted ATPase